MWHHPMWFDFFVSTCRTLSEISLAARVSFMANSGIWWAHPHACGAPQMAEMEISSPPPNKCQTMSGIDGTKERSDGGSEIVAYRHSRWPTDTAPDRVPTYRTQACIGFWKRGRYLPPRLKKGFGAQIWYQSQSTDMLFFLIFWLRSTEMLSAVPSGRIFSCHVAFPLSSASAGFVERIADGRDATKDRHGRPILVLVYGALCDMGQQGKGCFPFEITSRSEVTPGGAARGRGKPDLSGGRFRPVGPGLALPFSLLLPFLLPADKQRNGERYKGKRGRRWGPRRKVVIRWRPWRKREKWEVELRRSGGRRRRRAAFWRSLRLRRRSISPSRSPKWSLGSCQSLPLSLLRILPSQNFEPCPFISFLFFCLWLRWMASGFLSCCTLCRSRRS